MQCKICKNQISDNGVEVKNGIICNDCMELLPDSVKLNAKNFTVRQILQLSKMIQPSSSKNWVESGVFGVGKNTISIKKHEFQLKDLREVRLNFHPKAMGPHPNTVVGTITVVIETRTPHFLIEEPFFPDDVIVAYGISGKVITYHYSYTIETLFNLIQECIDKKVYDMTNFIDRYQQAVQKSDEYKKNKANAEAQKKKMEEDQKAKEEADRKKREEEQRQKQKEEKRKAYVGGKRPLSPFEEAKILFDVEMPYTTSDIKAIRNKLVKKYHPDLGGSEEMCKRVNEAYTLLSKFASS